MPRPTKLTPALQDALVTAVAAGVPLASAAALADVQYSTVKEWLQRGLATRKGRPSSGLYVSFAAAIMRARAQDEARRVARIEEAARGGAVIYRRTTTYKDGRTVVEERHAPPEWQADCWHLERSRPQEWGRRDQLKLQVEIEQIAARVGAELGLSADEVLAEAQLLLKEVDHGEI